ncbi:uncharacterized protein At2g29880 [Beta vulgaris subsp. vulgaris]|uniref:uncharacterized protein At2g29880 n=1 Tax=Beta vulgaris subsp. vulgaris TaxID=3555 RepID=UPI0025480B33|nr:uncharacterized protein At2g29880 [Beta vulgaris subsp. vulgaris]
MPFDKIRDSLRNLNARVGEKGKSVNEQMSLNTYRQNLKLRKTMEEQQQRRGGGVFVGGGHMVIGGSVENLPEKEGKRGKEGGGKAEEQEDEMELGTTHLQHKNESNNAPKMSQGRICMRWLVSEDRALICAMNDLVDLGGWKADNGQLENGAYAKLETLMKQKMPECEKKAKPHIESRVKLLRKQYDAISEMLSASASGFGWNDEGKFVTCPQTVWNKWIKSHQNAIGLRNKPFPFFDELGKIFGKDKTVGNESGNVHDVLEEMDEEEREDEGQEVPQYSVEEISPSSQNSPMGPPPSTTPSTRRTKKARTENI